jgi:hypothetical protein
MLRGSPLSNPVLVSFFLIYVPRAAAFVTTIARSLIVGRVYRAGTGIHGSGQLAT